MASSRPFSSASSGLLPACGMISGCSEGSRAIRVRASSVSGATTWASPAQATRAALPSRCWWSRSMVLSRARTRRFGLISSASIDGDRSKRITSAPSRLLAGRGIFSQVGPARARQVIRAAATVRIFSRAGARAARPPPLCTNSGSSAGAITLPQAPPLGLRCRASQVRASSKGRASNHSGRRK